MVTAPFNGSTTQLDGTKDISVWDDTSVVQCSDCSPTGSFTSTIVNKTYVVSSASVTTEAFVASITGTNLIVNCKNPTFTFEYKKDGTVLGSSPTWLTYDSVL